LHRVGLSADAANRLPHEFSGGQRQRIGLARALAPEPDILVADEPVSALDVSMRAEMLNLLTALRRRRGLAVVLIAHDLAMVRHAADRVAVMYSGKIVEMAPAEALFVAPQHPYTRELLASMPVADPAFERQVGVSVAEISQRSEWSSGCRFHPRCPLADERCRRHEPVLTGIAPGHLVSCHYPGEPEPRATKGENDGTF
jgi:oligopeptide/dipeptide ABC transporter ATP-binding protein